MMPGCRQPPILDTLRAVRRVTHSGGVALACVLLASCRPQGPTTLVTNTGQTRRLRPSEVEVVSAEAAGRRGLVGKPIAREFGADQDGTKLVQDLLAEARHQDADAVSDIAVTLFSRRDEGAVACRTAILPEAVQETR